MPERGTCHRLVAPWGALLSGPSVLVPAQGEALVEVGESLKLMADVKDCLDISVKQTFIDPLQLLQDKDLREIGVSPQTGLQSLCRLRSQRLNGAPATVLEPWVSSCLPTCS